MLPRALAPILFGALFLWPLRALACINAMDTAARDFHLPFLAELFFWSAGAVVMNRVFIHNVWGPTAEGQPRPTAARRNFFLVFGVALVLLLGAAWVGGSFMDVSNWDLSHCAMSIPGVAVLVASPILLFVLQALFFHGPGRRLCGTKRKAIMSLVLTSAVLVLGLGMARESIIFPELLCHNVRLSYWSSSYY
ncbi:hypothetical protein HJC10_15875 [Corallococcus exiguus]|uniref:hypothetical protein n=1 Tax=Corallococcus TaxID=83461 RepID=UPI000EC7299B|nr:MULTISPECIES: hypothetical protein [Corallococcus]NNB89052.1 hypothetical protein [Corallococcus exiguus]NNB96653.1 hypothetical protein [Corallococcus exiguus]NNC04316.1 hypothetical protein [Corallococcus exiguus]NPC50718.1 hypothetical protein [Corallococcus exiguus]RKH84531.1 hypothetical protein D7X99_09550 [Corallococcus sp. AB032C]